VTQCKDDRKEENCSASNGKAALAGRWESGANVKRTLPSRSSETPLNDAYNGHALKRVTPWDSMNCPGRNCSTHCQTGSPRVDSWQSLRWAAARVSEVPAATCAVAGCRSGVTLLAAVQVLEVRAEGCEGGGCWLAAKLLAAARVLEVPAVAGCDGRTC